MKPDAAQIRVLGVLLEKQRTTPDTYPLTLNALRAGCNQSTNRDPIVEFDDATIRGALEELARRRWTRAAGGTRAAKYRHLLADTLQIRPDEQAVLAVLMLRGPQTPGELRQRTERLHPFASTDELETTIDRLVTRRLVVRLERRPGQKEGRVQQIMGGDEPEPGTTVPSALAGASASAAAGPPASAGEASPSPGHDAGLAELLERVSRLEADDRVARLEAEVVALRAELAALREELGA